MTKRQRNWRKQKRQTAQMEHITHYNATPDYDANTACYGLVVLHARFRRLERRATLNQKQQRPRQNKKGSKNMSIRAHRQRHRQQQHRTHDSKSATKLVLTFPHLFARVSDQHIYGDWRHGVVICCCNGTAPNSLLAENAKNCKTSPRHNMNARIQIYDSFQHKISNNFTFFSFPNFLENA